jgi:hypothetical protein
VCSCSFVAALKEEEEKRMELEEEAGVMVRRWR